MIYQTGEQPSINPNQKEILLAPSCQETQLILATPTAYHSLISPSVDITRPRLGLHLIKVYKKKYGPTGAVERYKARWVVKGFHQVEGIDYNETFASVIKSIIWKSLLALEAKFDYKIEQLDIIPVFLESLMKETVFVDKPHRFEEPKGTSCARVCHLLRVLYGLKQSSREWYLTLVDYLKSLGYERLEHDHCVFVHRNGFIIAIYLNDLLLLVTELAKIGQLKKQLSDRFRMRDVGAIFWYLGIEVTRD